MISWAIWRASSRVGASIMTSSWPFLKRSLDLKYSTKGRQNANVLPDPVRSLAKTSWPWNIGEKHDCCTGNNLLNRHFRSCFAVSSLISGKCLKFPGSSSSTNTSWPSSGGSPGPSKDLVSASWNRFLLWLLYLGSRARCSNVRPLFEDDGGPPWRGTLWFLRPSLSLSCRAW